MKRMKSTKIKAINANRETTNPYFLKMCLTVEVDIPKNDYEVFLEIGDQYGEASFPLPPEWVMKDVLTEFADKYRDKKNRKPLKCINNIDKVNEE